MNKVLTVVIGVVAVVALIFGVQAYNKPTPKVVSEGVFGSKGDKGDKGEKGDRGAQGIQGVAGRDAKALAGAVSGPDTYFPYTANNDLQKFGQTRGLTTATTTVCSILSPSSTSTLTFGSVKFTVGSTTSSTVTIGKGSLPATISTILNQATLGANAQGTFMASTTALLSTGLIGDTVFAPNQYFQVSMAGGTGTFSPVGSCSAEFVRN